MVKTCQACGLMVDDSFSFCPSCGAQLKRGSVFVSGTWRTLRKLFLAVLTLVILASVISYFVSMAYGLWFFYYGRPESKLGTGILRGLPVTAFGLDFVESILSLNIILPFPITVNALFLLLWLAFAASFAASWALGRNFIRTINGVWKRPLAESMRNWLFAMPVVVSIVFTLVVALGFIQERGGVPTGTLQFPDPLIEFLSLSYAPVSEEIGYRLIPLGTLVLAITLFRGREVWRGLTIGGKIRHVAFCYLLPDRAKLGVGLPNVAQSGIRRGISRLEWVLVLLTSASFGLAHFASGAGWQIGKITLTFVPGLFLAALFLAYGAHASILLHWFTNSFLTPFRLAGTLGALLGLFPLLTFLATIVLSWIAVIVKGAQRLVRAFT